MQQVFLQAMQLSSCLLYWTATMKVSLFIQFIIIYCALDLLINMRVNWYVLERWVYFATFILVLVSSNNGWPHGLFIYICICILTCSYIVVAGNHSRLLIYDLLIGITSEVIGPLQVKGTMNEGNDISFCRVYVFCRFAASRMHINSISWINQSL